MTKRFLLCHDKDCRKRKKEHASLIEALSQVGEVEKVGCQDICKGPVVACVSKDRIIWFKRVDSKKARDGLITLASSGKIPKALEKRRLKKK